jgi:hypothetical protein
MPFTLRHQGELLKPTEGGYALIGQREYVLELREDIAAPTFPPGVCRCLAPRLWALNFSNYVGRSELMGVPVTVSTPKIDAGAFDAMLADVVEACEQLPFTFQAPTTLAFEADAATPLDVLYHRWVLLRAWVRGGRIEARLATSAAAVLGDLITEADGRPLLRLAGRSYVLPLRSAG